jgi:hypothetical protein
MHNQLNLQEREVLLQILDLRDRLVDEARERMEEFDAKERAKYGIEDEADVVFLQDSEAVERRLSMIRAKFFSECGAYDFALEMYGPLIEEHADLDIALTLAKAAWLAEDRTVCLHWAQRSMDLFRQLLDSETTDHYQFGICMLNGFRLAKVMALLGRQDAVQALQPWLLPLIYSENSDSEILMNAMRYAVELGWHDEAKALCKQLPHLVIGHSRGNLWKRTFGTLLDHDYELYAWSLLGMAVDKWARELFHDFAMRAAAERGRYQLAIEFVAASGFEGGWSGLTSLANYLVGAGQTSKWNEIWDLIHTRNNSSRFSQTEKMRFLATVIAHCPPGERTKIYITAQVNYRGLQNSSNLEYVREFNEIFLSIAAWAGDEEFVQGLLFTTKPHKDFLKTTLNAALHQDWEFLVDAVWLQMLATRRVMPLERVNIDHLRLELARYQAGRSNTLEEQFAEAKAMALLMEPHELISQLKSFVLREWKDIDRYRSLIAETAHMRGIISYDHEALLMDAARAGDLARFYHELEQSTDDHDEPSSIDRPLQQCLQTRTGLGSAFLDF